MNEWLLLIVAATAGSILSLVGGVYLLYGKKGALKLQKYAVPFAAGALLAATFLALLPEALHAAEASPVLIAVLGAFLGFFVLEHSLSWFHHHHEEAHGHTHTKRNVWLIVIGDTLHNLLDGIAIGAAFLISPATGVVAAIAIAAHEIPQEIGDFGLMLSKGMAKRRVLIVNLVSALATVVGAVSVYALGGNLPVSEGILLAITAGFFIYIAASDIIPTIHAEPTRRTANIKTIVLIVGVVFVGIISHIAHCYIDHDHSHDAESSHHIDGHHEHDEHHDHHEDE